MIPSRMWLSCIKKIIFHFNFLSCPSNYKKLLSIASWPSSLPLPQFLPVTINMNWYIFIQTWQNNISLFHLLGCECSPVYSQLKELAQVLFSEKNIMLPYLTPKRRWAASSAWVHYAPYSRVRLWFLTEEEAYKLKFNHFSELLTLSFHHVDCSGLSQHYKITYPWLLAVNKYHLL